MSNIYKKIFRSLVAILLLVLLPMTLSACAGKKVHKKIPQIPDETVIFQDEHIFNSRIVQENYIYICYDEVSDADMNSYIKACVQEYSWVEEFGLPGQVFFRYKDLESPWKLSVFRTGNETNNLTICVDFEEDRHETD